MGIINWYYIFRNRDRLKMRGGSGRSYINLRYVEVELFEENLGEESMLEYFGGDVWWKLDMWVWSIREIRDWRFRFGIIII